MRTILEAAEAEFARRVLRTARTEDIAASSLCAYYFCAANNFADPASRVSPFSKEALSRHAKEVMVFVELRTRIERE